MADEPRPFPPPIDGTEQRLDAIHAELKGLRQDLADVFGAESSEPGGVEELRGAGPPPRNGSGAPDGNDFTYDPTTSPRPGAPTDLRRRCRERTALSGRRRGRLSGPGIAIGQARRGDGAGDDRLERTLLRQKIKLVDLMLDGPAVATSLREHAKNLRAEAEEEESWTDGGAFDIAEMPIGPFAARERLLTKPCGRRVVPLPSRPPLLPSQVLDQVADVYTRLHPLGPIHGAGQERLGDRVPSTQRIRCSRCGGTRRAARQPPGGVGSRLRRCQRARSSRLPVNGGTRSGLLLRPDRWQRRRDVPRLRRRTGEGLAG
jgi:hypothetical protein